MKKLIIILCFLVFFVGCSEEKEDAKGDLKNASEEVTDNEESISEEVDEKGSSNEQSKIELTSEEGNDPNDLINLYFADDNAENVVPEDRNIKDVTPEKAIQALIDGPKSENLHRTLPEEMEVISVSVEDGVASVQLEESIPEDKRGNYGSSASSNMFIESIKNTLILNEQFGIEVIIIEGNICELLQVGGSELILNTH